VSSCASGGEDVIEGKLTVVNIQDAKSLFISKIDDYSSKLYGVRSKSGASLGKTTGEDLEYYEISFIDEYGDTIKKDDPTYIFNVKDFIILSFGSQGGFRESFLIKKTDGKVFEIPYTYQPHIVYNKYAWGDQYSFMKDKIQEDANNNIYYMHYQTSSPHKNTLYKISLNIPSLLVFEEISAVNDDVYGFCVDSLGYVMYHSGYYSDKKVRYRRPTGELTMNSAFDELDLIWKGVDGVMYAVRSIYNENTHRRDKAFVKLADEAITPISLIPDGVELSMIYLDNENKYNVYQVQGNIILSQQGKLFNLSKEDKLGFVACDKIASAVIDDELYSFDPSTFTCYKIDISTGATTLEYSLDKTKIQGIDIDNILTVSLDGVTFSGVNLSNGQYVVAKISTDNSVTVQQSIAGKVTYVQAIN
jgi:hypothetical protein